MREAALWFGVGGAVAGFVVITMFLMATAVGVDATTRLARAVGTRVDKLAGLDPPKCIRRDARIGC